MTLQLVHHDEIGSTFAIQSATYLLDGRQILQLKGSELQRQLAESPGLLEIPLSVGVHVIALRLVYVGKSGVFQYLDRYHFTMKGYLLVDSKPGYQIKVISKVEQRDPLTVKWQNRPSFKLAALPQKAVLKVRVGPVERSESKADDPDDGQPVVIAIAEEDAKLLENLGHQEAPAVPTEQPSVAQVQLTASGCGPLAVHFQVGRSALNRKARRALEQFSACLLRAPAKRIRVEGRCDRRGSDALNERLGFARARTTADFLVQRGVMPARLEAVSLGKRQLVCSELNEDCYTRNRRADFIEIPDNVGPSSSPSASLVNN